MLIFVSKVILNLRNNNLDQARIQKPICAGLSSLIFSFRSHNKWQATSFSSSSIALLLLKYRF